MKNKNNRSITLAILNIIAATFSFLIGALLIINSIKNFRK